MIPAGRELDKIIATKVMGWIHENDSPWTRVCNGKFHFKCGACGASGHGNCYGDGTGPIQIECDCVPHYSTDIAAAWEVAQRVIDQNSEGDFVVHLSPSEHEECEIELKYWDKSDIKDPVLIGPFYILGETAPHAICMAALKACGVEL